VIAIMRFNGWLKLSANMPWDSPLFASIHIWKTYDPIHASITCCAELTKQFLSRVMDNWRGRKSHLSIICQRRSRKKLFIRLCENRMYRPCYTSRRDCCTSPLLHSYLSSNPRPEGLARSSLPH
jgi:hypothetical protein